MPEYVLTGLAIAIAMGFAIAWFIGRENLRKQKAELRLLNDEVEGVVSSARFDRSLPPHDDNELDHLGKHFSTLFTALNAKEEQSRERESLFTDLANTIPDVVLVHNHTIQFANKGSGELLGADAESLLGRNITDLVRPAYRSMALKIIDRVMEGKRQGSLYELQLIDSEDQTRWFEASGVLIKYRGRDVVLTVARDISYRKSVEATLSRGRQLAQITLESLVEGVITTDTDGKIDYMNSAAEKLVGVERDSGVGLVFANVVKLVDESDRRELSDPVSRCLNQRQRISMGRRAGLMHNGAESAVSIDATASPIIGPNRNLAGVVVVMRDVSEMRGITREISYQASHDALTGLVNRREFERQVSAALSSVRAEDNHHVLLFLDLDRFKAVNDTCGHAAGDNLLREVSSLLRVHVRDSDLVARQGGDEFGILLIGCPLDKARQISGDICRAMREYRYNWEDRTFEVGVSIGLVEITGQSTTLEDVLGAADSACYVAKQKGRGQVHVYSARDETAARQRGEIHWLRKIQFALRDDGFELFSQPIISVAGRIDRGPAVEVLLRMRGENNEMIFPKEFIPAAERYQLVGTIDRWVVQAALTAVANGRIRLPDRRSIAINISGQTMAEDSFLDFVVGVLDHTGVEPEQVCFEVSEVGVLRDIEHARRFIGVLHGMGCTFGLDDFGVDVGSLSSLPGLGLDYLKLDGICTIDMCEDSVHYELVSAVSRLSRAVGFRIIAEQVEDQECFHALRELGIDFIQGNFVDPPSALRH